MDKNLIQEFVKKYLKLDECDKIKVVQRIYELLLSSKN